MRLHPHSRSRVMRSFVFRSAGLALAAACALPLPSGAQGDTATVPVSFVGALLGSSGRTSTLQAVTVGRAPRGFPASLVPPSMKVVGGAVVYGRPVLLLRDSSARALATFQAHLQAAGFLAPTPPESGFQPSGVDEDGWCRDSSRVSPTVVNGEGGRLLRVTYWTQDRRGDPIYRPTCSETRRAPIEEVLLKLPPLPPPPGASQGSSGGGSRGGGHTSTQVTVMDTTRGAAEMGRWFAGLLASAGWTVMPPVANARVSATVLDATDARKKAWRGLLLVETRGKEHSVSLTMRMEGR
jgi:hypothetical protein